MQKTSTSPHRHSSAGTPRPGVEWPGPRFSGSKLKLSYSHTHSADHRNHNSTSTRPNPPDPSRPYFSQAEASDRGHLSQAAIEHSSHMSSEHQELRKTTDLYTFPQSIQLTLSSREAKGLSKATCPAKHFQHILCSLFPPPQQIKNIKIIYEESKGIIQSSE